MTTRARSVKHVKKGHLVRFHASRLEGWVEGHVVDVEFGEDGYLRVLVEWDPEPDYPAQEDRTRTWVFPSNLREV